MCGLCHGTGAVVTLDDPSPAGVALGHGLVEVSEPCPVCGENVTEHDLYMLDGDRETWMGTFATVEEAEAHAKDLASVVTPRGVVYEVREVKP